MPSRLPVPLTALPKIRWQEVVFGRDGARKTLLDFLFFATVWTPGIVLVFMFSFDPIDELKKSFFISMVIAESALTFCYWGSQLMSACERLYYQFKGMPFRARSTFDLLKGSIFMLPGMYVGFTITAWLAGIYGFDWRTPDLGNYKRGMVVGLFSMILFAVIFLRHEAEQSRKRAESEKRELNNRTMKAQIAALTAQMNPHLLFNSLNSIASLIQSSPDQAEDMTMELSKLYRKVLDASKKETHSLADEIELCHSYLAVEKARFSDRISYAIEIDRNIDPAKVHIPVLCLQPFVENAVKHGLLPRSAGGNLTIQVHKLDNGLTIRVVDDGVGLAASGAVSGSGTALVNCRERLLLAHGESANITIQSTETQGTIVLIFMPLDERTT